MRDEKVKMTVLHDGTIKHGDMDLPCLRHCVFDAGKSGTAHIYVAQVPGTEEDRRRNRAAIQDALKAMAISCANNEEGQ